MAPESLFQLDRPARYQIVVQGKLPETWNDYFGEMIPVALNDSDGLTITTLIGDVADQSSLYGLLAHLRDLGLPLLQLKLLSEKFHPQGDQKMLRSDSFNSIFHLALKGIALAMSVAALVTGMLKTASTETLVTLLTIGLAALAFSSLTGE